MTINRSGDDGKYRVLIAIGTRPEAIKMAPVIRAIRESRRLIPITCATGQHRDLLDQALDLFEIEPDFDLDLMRPDQDLFDVTSRCLLECKQMLQAARPDLVLVQGDTATAFTTALAAFYLRIPVGHVEAGLRTRQRYSPFPEEIYRRMLTQIADLHFAPTERAASNVRAENVDPGLVFTTGNTCIDALLWMGPRATRPESLPENVVGKKMILLTVHRRESFGSPLREIFSAMRDFAGRHPQFHLVYPVHPNPNVSAPAREILSDRSNVSLIAPVGYGELVYLLRHCHFVVTDSGGIQEEAPSFGKPILVLRETTERPEAIEAGCARLVGADREKILETMERLLDADSLEYRSMANRRNPFGDGTAATQIVSVLEIWLHEQGRLKGSRILAQSAARGDVFRRGAGAIETSVVASP